MTKKKKIISKEIKDMIKRMTKITTQKSSSHINENDELIQDKYNSHISHDIKSKWDVPEHLEAYERDILNRKIRIDPDNIDDISDIYRKKSRSIKTKKCRCKK